MHRPAPTRHACRCSTTSCSTTWAPTPTSTAAAQAPTAPYPVKGVSGAFTGFPSTLNGGDLGEQPGPHRVIPDDVELPAEGAVPAVRQRAPIEWDRPGGSPFDPDTGDWYVYSQTADVVYKRLTRTVDLTGKTTGELTFQTSYDTEADWDHMFVEAHTVGPGRLDDAARRQRPHQPRRPATAAPAGGATHAPVPRALPGRGLLPTGTHRGLERGQRQSNGWQDWNVDLSAYAGKQVELSISYVSDWGTQGIGIFLDDAKVTADGATVTETSFEPDLGGWTVAGPPAGSAAAANDWTRTQTAFDEGAGVSPRTRSTSVSAAKA